MSFKQIKSQFNVLRDIWIDNTLFSEQKSIRISNAFSRDAYGLSQLTDTIKNLNSSIDISVDGIDVSSNIAAGQLNSPSDCKTLFNAFHVLLSTNHNIKAINIANNHLFEFSAHPLNNHSNYLEDFVDTLMASAIETLDISNNCITGSSRRMLKGLTALMKVYLLKKCRKLICQHNSLHGLAFKSIACGLGNLSSLTYLDLSNNFGGVDAFGNVSSDGFGLFTQQLAVTPNLKILKLAKNYIHDDEIILLANAVKSMLLLKLLDLSGNYCMANGAEALKEAILSHSTLETPRYGLEHIYLSDNPLHYSGIVHISEALSRSDNISTIRLDNCNIDDEGMVSLQTSLAQNNAVIQMDISNNPAKQNLIARANAEVVAEKLLGDIYADPMGVDAGALTQIVYLALARKLRFLPVDTLKQLHYNKSFNELHSPMAEALHRLVPLPRSLLIQNILNKDEKIQKRIEFSKQIDTRSQAATKVVQFMIKCRNKKLYAKRIQDVIKRVGEKRVYGSNFNSDKFSYS